jgi:signal transduction histidine kinase
MKWLATMVMLYMLAALCWWSTLLLKQNDAIFDLSKTTTHFVDEKAITTAEGKWIKQKKMILGEGLVFGISLLLGIYLIYRSSRKEIETTKKQNNFLLSFSHELKSPLTAINLSLDTIKKRQLPHETQQEICGRALKESRRLEALINSILMVAKIDDFTLTKERIDLYNMTSDIVQVMNATGEAKSEIILHKNTEDNAIEADKQAVQSILINIIENAIKYGNKLPINIGFRDSKEHVLVTVADQGIGISAEEKAKIFDRFYRVGDESVRKSKGTGLGLFIVKKLVEAHNGAIQVSDSVPHGTTFTISLPKNIAV